jgi:basic amino acid/polyamine antiporter, APA family
MTDLVRTLRLRDLFLIVVGGVIGSGIFLVPTAVLNQVDHSVGLALLVWICGGVLALLGAFTYTELAAMKPEAGGLYIYIRDGFGRLPAFLYGWAMLLAIASGAVAGLAAGFATYLGAIIPLGYVGSKLASYGMIAAVTALNVWGTRKSSDVQNLTTITKALLVLGISITLLLLGHNLSASFANLLSTPGSTGLVSKFGLALITALWAYEGWHFAIYSAGEAVNPQRDYPRAIVMAVLVLVALYLLANVSYLAALGPTRAAHSERIAADSVATLLGSNAAKLVTLTILISVFSGANSVILTAPRVFYAMAKDGLFFQKLAEVHPRFRTPAAAVVLMGAWSCVLVSVGKFSELIGYAIFVAWIFYALAGASIFVYRRRVPDLARPYRVPLYPLPPLLFVLAASLIVLNAVVSDFAHSAIGLGIVTLGLPVYFVWARATRPHRRESAQE